MLATSPYIARSPIPGASDAVETYSARIVSIGLIRVPRSDGM
jgi:hypothetical protein